MIDLASNEGLCFLQDPTMLESLIPKPCIQIHPEFTLSNALLQVTAGKAEPSPAPVLPKGSMEQPLFQTPFHPLKAREAV